MRARRGWMTEPARTRESERERERERERGSTDKRMRDERDFEVKAEVNAKQTAATVQSANRKRKRRSGNETIVLEKTGRSGPNKET
jgi:hypothetical protein